MKIATSVLLAFALALSLDWPAHAQIDAPRRIERRDATGRETDGRDTDRRSTEAGRERERSDTDRTPENERTSERDRVSERAAGEGRGSGGGAGSGTGGERRTTERSDAVLTHEGYGKIVRDHAADSSVRNSGKFAEGTSESRIRQMVNETTLYGKDRPNTKDRNGKDRDGTIYEHEFGQTIGVDSRGNATSRLRVVVGPAHEVVTAFPY